MAQQQPRHPHSASTSRPVRPVGSNYERGRSLKPTFHQAPISQSRRPSGGSSSVEKRRSSSLSRHPNYQVHSTNPHHQYSHGRTSPQYPHFYRPESSDADSVASAPSLKYNKELRDARSTTGRPIQKGKLFRDDSPVSRRPSETSQKDVKMARKVIEGKIYRSFSSAQP
jgi:hypothetical protein